MKEIFEIQYPHEAVEIDNWLGAQLEITKGQGVHVIVEVL